MILMLFQALSYFDKQLFGLLSAPLSSGLGLSDLHLGLLQGLAFSLPYSIATLGFGWAADRYSPRILLFACVFLWSLAALSTGLAWSFASVFCARIALGVGEAGLQPCAYKIIARTASSAHMGTAVSFYTSGGIMGSAGALMLGGAIINALTLADGVALPVLGHLAPWQASFVSLGLPGLLTAFAAFFLPRLAASPAPAPDIKVADASGLKAFWMQHRVLLSCHYGIFALLGISLFASMAWTPVHLVRNFNMSFKDIGLIMGAATAAGAIGGTLWGVLSDALRRQGMMTATYLLLFCLSLIGAPCGVAAFLVTSPTLFTILFCLNCAFGSFSVLAAVVPQFAPTHLIGRLFGIQAFVLGSLGAGLAPLIVAALTENLFGNPASVGKALSLTTAACGTGACTLLALGLKPLRTAIGAFNSKPQAEEPGSNPKILAV